MIASTPHDFYHAIEWSLKFGVPIIITENGTEDAEDTFRREYLAAHIHQLWRAVNFNYPIKGYFVWTLVDNFEWNARLDAPLWPLGAGYRDPGPQKTPQRRLLRQDRREQCPDLRDGARIRGASGCSLSKKTSSRNKPKEECWFSESLITKCLHFL